MFLRGDHMILVSWRPNTSLVLSRTKFMTQYAVTLRRIESRDYCFREFLGVWYLRFYFLSLFLFPFLDFLVTQFHNIYITIYMGPLFQRVLYVSSSVSCSLIISMLYPFLDFLGLILWNLGQDYRQDSSGLIQDCRLDVLFPEIGRRLLVPLCRKNLELHRMMNIPHRMISILLSMWSIPRRSFWWVTSSITWSPFPQGIVKVLRLWYRISSLSDLAPVMKLICLTFQPVLGPLLMYPGALCRTGLCDVP